MNYLERVQECHQCDDVGFFEFVIEGEIFGLISPSFTEQLLRWPDTFQCKNQQIILNPELDSLKNHGVSQLDMMEFSMVRTKSKYLFA